MREHHSNSRAPPTLEAARADFLRQFGDVYGCDGAVELARSQDLSRLRDSTYLDFAGAVPYTDSQLEGMLKELSGRIHINPHSAHGGSRREENSAREATLKMCRASSREYDVIFTSGATEALRMVADAFPWSSSSVFAYTQDNHNSVVGIREVALDRGATAMSGIVEINQKGVAVFTQTSTGMRRSPSPLQTTDGPHLFAFPLESNFNGVRYDAELINIVSSTGIKKALSTASCNGAANEQEWGSGGHCAEAWFVLLDAAKACGTSPPDLGKHPAHFVAISFYKIFGYPTGLGALLVRKDALGVLKHGYFGGGTLEMVVPNRDIVKRKQGHEGWEHGTSNFLAIAAVRTGFDRLQQLGGFDSIDRHACSLTKWLLAQLSELRHLNGSRACHLYHPEAWVSDASFDGLDRLDQSHGECSGIVGQGPVITFNLLASDGSWVGYSEVTRLAELHRIYFRAGRFCNPGACSLWMGLGADGFVAHHQSGHVCGDSIDLVDGKPTGAIRVSLGWCSTFCDVHKLVWFVNNYFVENSHEGDLWGAPPASEGCGREINHSEHAGQPKPICTKPRLGHSPQQTQVAPPGDIPESKESSHLNPSQRPTATLGQPVSGGSAASNKGQFDQPNPRSGLHVGKWKEVGCLSALSVFPIKSCGAQAVDSWPIDSGGLLYDRHWAILDEQGTVLTIGKHPEMARIKPRLDLKNRTLTICHPSQPNCICISIDQELGVPCCADKSLLTLSASRWCPEAISLWLESVLSQKCTLVVSGGTGEGCSACDLEGMHQGQIRGFSNRGGVSLVSTGSILGLGQKLVSKKGLAEAIDLDAMRFRMNMVVDVGLVPHEEDEWGVFAVGNCGFRKLEGCGRCDVVLVNSNSGMKDGKDVLLTLAEYRRTGGRVRFGTICIRESGTLITVGDCVSIPYVR